MARGRMLSKTLSVSRRFNAIAETAEELTEFTQLLYALLVPHTDDFGRMSGDPFSLKMTVLPASSRALGDFTAALNILHDVHLITVYEMNSDIWLQVNKFDEHQVGLHKRTESKIPSPLDGTSRKFPEVPGNSWSRARAELNLTEGKGTEGKGIIKAVPKTAPARSAPVENPDRNVRIITKIAHEVLQRHIGNGATGADMCDEVKTLCASRHIRYDASVVRKALDSAEVQRKVRRL